MRTSQWLTAVVLVGIGGFVGSALRFILSLAVQRYEISFPHGTLWANWAGCLLIGILASLASATEILSPSMRLLLATGFCGGLTTMSTFMYELLQFVRDREYLYAGGYLGMTLLGCVVMFCIGLLLTQWVIRPGVKPWS